MFVIEGVLPWIWAVIWAIAVEDWPRTAPWIAPAEREFIETALAAERADRELKTATHLGQALRTAQAWIFAIAYIGPNVASYGVSFFLPSLLKHAGYPIGVVGLLTALPFAMATVGILVHGFLADRSMHRRVHVIVPVAVLGVGLIISSLFQTVAPVVAILLLIAAGWGLYAYLGPFWTVVEQTFPAETAGPVMGFVNAIGNISGFFGPLVVGALVSSTHSYEPGFLFLGAWALIAVGLMSLIRIKEGAAARVTPGLTVSD
jgi:nitrate/nitrite transporter NarK